MHCKNYIYIFFLFISVVSCSTNKNNHLKTDITLAEEKEILIQKKILINEMVTASKKLHKITWPILLKNKDKCKNNKNKSYGSLFADIEDLPEEDQNIFFSIFNKHINSKYFKKYQVSAFPIVLSVARNSPAFDAGLLEDDIILEINDMSTKGFRKRLAFFLKMRII